MKILMTTDTVGGVWHYSIDLVRALLEEEIEVLLLAMGPMPSSGQQEEVKKHQKSGLSFFYKPYKLEWMENPWEDVEEAGRWLLKLKDEVQPDLVHLNGLGHGDLDWGVPVVTVSSR